MISYLTRTVEVVWTVILVDYNGVLDINHFDVKELNTLYKPCAGSCPGFDPQTILGTLKNRIFECYILDSFLYQIFGQAPNAAITTQEHTLANINIKGRNQKLPLYSVLNAHFKK